MSRWSIIENLKALGIGTGGDYGSLAHGRWDILRKHSMMPLPCPSVNVNPDRLTVVGAKFPCYYCFESEKANYTYYRLGPRLMTITYKSAIL